jgi:hypothetical protein
VSLWRQTKRHGERLAAYVKRQQEQVSPQRVVLPGPHADHPRRKGVSLDGGMVNIRGEGWKEVKVGAVYDVEQRLERDPVTRELVEQPHGVNLAYTAVLGGVEQFAPALWALAVHCAVPQAAGSSVTADGAEWIWNLVADYFPDSVQIVDWYHACQHLAGAASALYPQDAQAAQRWYQHRRDDLFKGSIHMITLPLDHASLSDQAHYFHTHKRRSTSSSTRKAVRLVLARLRVASSSSRRVSPAPVCAGHAPMLNTCSSSAPLSYPVTLTTCGLRLLSPAPNKKCTRTGRLWHTQPCAV